MPGRAPAPDRRPRTPSRPGPRRSPDPRREWGRAVVGAGGSKPKGSQPSAISAVCSTALGPDRTQVDRDRLLHRLRKQLQGLPEPGPIRGSAAETRDPVAQAAPRVRAPPGRSRRTHGCAKPGVRNRPRASLRSPAAPRHQGRVGSARRTLRRASPRSSRSSPDSAPGIWNSPEPRATRSVTPLRWPSTDAASWPHASDTHTESSSSSSASRASSICSSKENHGQYARKRPARTLRSSH